MSTLTLVIPRLTTSNWPWFMDLTFQVPMQYCSLQHRALLLSPVPSTSVYCFFLWLHPFVLYGVISPLISSSTLGTYRPGEFLFQYPIILPFHTVHGVLKARILKWFAFPFSSGPRSVSITLGRLFSDRWDCVPILLVACPGAFQHWRLLGGARHWCLNEKL